MMSAYSANETDTVAFLHFQETSAFQWARSTTYLNDAPFGANGVDSTHQAELTFQFTMGLTYAIKSKY